MTADDETQKRRRRTDAYCRMWALPLPDVPSPVLTADAVSIRTAANVRVHTLLQCLLGLKGQGLSQREVFAFADAYGLWEAMNVEEHDYVLDDASGRSVDVQMAWRYERVNVLLWALARVRHLHLPDQVVDPAAMLSAALPALTDPSIASLRAKTDLVDAADLAIRLEALATAGVGTLNRGVVHERAQAFRWLCPPVCS